LGTGDAIRSDPIRSNPIRSAPHHATPVQQQPSKRQRLGQHQQHRQDQGHFQQAPGPLSQQQEIAGVTSMPSTPARFSDRAAELLQLKQQQLRCRGNGGSSQTQLYWAAPDRNDGDAARPGSAGVNRIYGGH
jgi:hypothetical protein